MYSAYLHSPALLHSPPPEMRKKTGSTCWWPHRCSNRLTTSRIWLIKILLLLLEARMTSFWVSGISFFICLMRRVNYLGLMNSSESQTLCPVILCTYICKFYEAWGRFLASQNLVNIGSGNGLVPSGTKLLGEPMLTYWDSVAFTLGQFQIDCSR